MTIELSRRRLCLATGLFERRVVSSTAFAARREYGAATGLFLVTPNTGSKAECEELPRRDFRIATKATDARDVARLQSHHARMQDAVVTAIPSRSDACPGNF
ncbi:hypothetical protein RAD16_16555 [Bradyrhizobium sp. 18BD]